MKLIYILLFAFMFTACASVGPTNKQKVLNFKSKYEPKSMSDVSSRDCKGTHVLKKFKELKSLMSYANSCVKVNRWKRVLTVSRLMLEKHSKAPWGAYYLSLSALHSKHFERALWMVDLAQKKAPNVGLLEFQKARIHWKLKNQTLAVKSLEKALSLDPKIIEAHLFLAQIYARDAMPSKALEHYKYVLTKESDNLSALHGISQVYIDTGEHKLAVTHLKKSLRKNSKSLIARLNLALLYEEKLLNLSAALDAYEDLQSDHGQSKVIKVTGVSVKKKIKNLKSKIVQTQKLTKKRNLSSLSKTKKKGVTK